MSLNGQRVLKKKEVISIHLSPTACHSCLYPPFRNSPMASRSLFKINTGLCQPRIQSARMTLQSKLQHDATTILPCSTTPQNDIITIMTPVPSQILPNVCNLVQFCPFIQIMVGQKFVVMVLFRGDSPSRCGSGILLNFCSFDLDNLSFI